MDATAIIGAVGAANHVVALLRSTADSVKGLGKAELVSQLLEAQITMMDFLQKHQELQNQNQELQRTIEELKATLNKTLKVEYHYEAYWLRGDDGSLGGPYSPQVWDIDRKLFRMDLIERIEYSDQTKPVWFRFGCLKFPKHSCVPLDFMRVNRVWSEEEFDVKRPNPKPRTVKA